MTMTATMRFLLTLLLLNTSRIHGLCAPGGIRRRSWFGTCEREHAQISLAMWLETMLRRGDMYPDSSYKSSYDAIDHINANRKRLGLLTWNHVYQNDYHIISHIILTRPSRDTQTLAICGIVENPDNVIYNKSIIPMVESLAMEMSRKNTTVVLNPLREWNNGIYFALLTMKLRNK